MKSVQESKPFHGNVKCECGQRFNTHITLGCEFKPNKMYVRKKRLKFLKKSQLSLFN